MWIIGLHNSGLGLSRLLNRSYMPIFKALKKLMVNSAYKKWVELPSQMWYNSGRSRAGTAARGSRDLEENLEREVSL